LPSQSHVTTLQVLLLDEPTSGLDAASTLALVDQLRKLGEGGKMVLIAIHQPRREVWDLFHHVVCFSEGQVVYVDPIPSV
jgi:ABC-type multidrug transport system ATPase subunit